MQSPAFRVALRKFTCLVHGYFFKLGLKKLIGVSYGARVSFTPT